MERTPQRDRLTQLGLFRERAVAPRWSELSEPTRVEVLRLLAQLLREARAPPLRSEGVDDE
jgi:DNA-binding transcriptional ArsR family regulator